MNMFVYVFIYFELFVNTSKTQEISSSHPDLPAFPTKVEAMSSTFPASLSRPATPARAQEGLCSPLYGSIQFTTNSLQFLPEQGFKY